MGSAATKSTKNNEMNYRPYLRGAYHAGSWYSGDFDTLDKTLSEFLNKAADDASQQQQVEQQPFFLCHVPGTRITSTRYTKLTDLNKMTKKIIYSMITSFLYATKSSV